MENCQYCRKQDIGLGHACKGTVAASDLRDARQDIAVMESTLRGCRDMLRECAKQFRAMGITTGHPVMADLHADAADKVLA